VDLCGATFMDSTNLGYLAAIARQALAAGGPRPLLVGAGEEMRELLLSMRLDKAFLITEAEPPAGGDWSDLIDEAADVSERERARTILAAHEALAELDEDNRATFQAVIDLLREQTRERDTE